VALVLIGARKEAEATAKEEPKVDTAITKVVPWFWMGSTPWLYALLSPTHRRLLTPCVILFFSNNKLGRLLSS
jgi:hypothetical protein